MAALSGDGPQTPGVAVAPVDLSARIDEALAVQALAFGLSDDEVDVRRHIVHRHLLHPGARALGALTETGHALDLGHGELLLGMCDEQEVSRAAPAGGNQLSRSSGSGAPITAYGLGALGNITWRARSW